MRRVRPNVCPLLSHRERPGETSSHGRINDAVTSSPCERRIHATSRCQRAIGAHRLIPGRPCGLRERDRARNTCTTAGLPDRLPRRRLKPAPVPGGAGGGSRGERRAGQRGRECDGCPDGGVEGQPPGSRQSEGPQEDPPPAQGAHQAWAPLCPLSSSGSGRESAWRCRAASPPLRSNRWTAGSPEVATAMSYAGEPPSRQTARPYTRSGQLSPLLDANFSRSLPNTPGSDRAVPRLAARSSIARRSLQILPPFDSLTNAHSPRPGSKMRSSAEAFRSTDRPQP
jgi:hypothetical protein